MRENSQLWSRKDGESIRTTLKDYLNRDSISYDDNATTDELRLIYIDTECGRKLGG